MPITDYRNFDLLITRSGDRYRAFVVDAPAGEASVIFDPPFATDELARLSAGAATDRAGLGRQLFEAVFRDNVHTVLATSLASVAQEGAGLRLRLRFEEDAADLAALPWETLYDPGQGHFVGLGEQSPILRYLSLPRSRSALLVEPPLRVLAVLASPAGLVPLDIDREWQLVQDSLAGLVAEGKFVLERLKTPSLAALQERLLNEPVHILHFVGHGVFDEASQAGSLALEDARGRLQLVRGEQLAAILRNHPTMRLAYLNACEGALASGQSVFTGVAQTLVREGVPAAVAMQAEISDSAAIELARSFYTALAAGRPVDAALTQARVALAAAGSPEWAIPVLFSRSPDNRLFDIREVLPTPDCPYPGMAPFTEAQKDLFFGRDKEIEDAVERLRQHPFLAVVGPSGSGKSSLINAGVIPALRTSRRFGPGAWTIHTMRPSDSRTPEGKAAPRQALTRLLGGTVDELASQTFDHRTLLLVDQFEELFTLAEAGEAQAFLDALQALMGRPNLYLLLTVRADFYPDLMACSLWQPIRANRLEVTPLGDDELWAAIVEPAARVGVTVDEALAVQLIADAAGESGVLPLVQETLVLLWDKVERRQLRLAAYRGMAAGVRSGLQVAIDRRASLIYENLPDGVQPIARRIFLRLIQFGEGRADTRRQQTVEELRASGDDPALFDRTLARLTESRLLTTSGDVEGSARRVDIAHEALIAGWPRLQEWLGQRRTAEQTRRQLEAKAAEWVRLGRGEGGLLDEYELYEAQDWLASGDSGELGFSQAVQDLVIISREALTQAKRDKAEATRTRQRSRFFAGGLALAVAVIALVGWFWWQSRLSEGEAVKAQATAEINEKIAVTAKATAVAANAEIERLTRAIRADQLTANGLKVLDENPQLALLLSVEGVNVQRALSETVVASALSNMHDLLQQAGGTPLVGHEDAVYAVAFSPDGRWLATASEDGTARLWEVANPAAAPRVLAGHVVWVSGGWLSSLALAFSPDGRWLATAGGDNTASLWEVANPAAAPRVLAGHADRVVAVAFSPDGRWLATASFDNTVRLWEVANPAAAPRILAGHTGGGVSALVFSPDGRWLATANGDKAASLWEVANPAAPRVLAGHESGVSAVAFSPDGRWLATASDDNTARLWEVANPAAAPRVLAGHTGPVSAVAFSPDGRWLATASRDKTARLWEVANPVAEPIVLAGHESPVRAVAFSPDGRWLATASDDGTARLWEVANPAAAPRVLAGHPYDVVAVAFSPDGRWLATANNDHTARLWEVANSAAVPRVLAGHAGPVYAVAFSPDDRWLATASQDKTARLWEVANPAAAPRVLAGHAGFLTAVAFSPDGRWLATASWD
ncbi:MAG: CHAT domain-containing protein [Chloroflexi bacterium]|nr:CHAT domain-containing protein [Chloroflexota bacterium]